MLLWAIVLVSITLVSPLEEGSWGHFHGGDEGGDDYDEESGDSGLTPEFGELGCNNDPVCKNLVQTAKIVRKQWYIKWGWTYKGLKEVPASSIEECAEQCLGSKLCFVTSWADNKCYVQDDGVAELKSENLEARSGAITFLGRVKRLVKFRKFAKFFVSECRGSPSDDESKSDDTESKFGGEYPGSSSDDESKSDDTESKFGDAGCQNNQRCEDLVKLAKISRKQWLVILGKKYKGSKGVPAKDVKECFDICLNSDNCFVVSWTEDNKCHIQDDGVTDLTPDKLEPSTNAVTFLGKVKRVIRFRKFKKRFGSEVPSPDSVDPAPENVVLPPDSVDPAPENVVPPPYSVAPSPESVVPPPESLLPPPDSLAPPPDDVVPPPDSIVPPPESVVPPSESVLPPPDNVVTPPENVVPPPDNVVPPPESVVPPPENVLPQPDNVVQLPENAVPLPDSVVPPPENVVPPPDSVVPQPDNVVPPPESIVPLPGATSTSDDEIPPDNMKMPDEDEDVPPPEFGEMGCQNDNKCKGLVNKFKKVRRYWYIKRGQFYKESKEIQAQDLIECAEACLKDDKCFVISWADEKCFVQDDGKTELKPEYLVPRDDSVTFLGKKKRILKLRIFRKAQGTTEGFPEEDYDVLPGKRIRPGKHGESESKDDDESLAPAFGEVGCQNDKQCSDLVKQIGKEWGYWFIIWGRFYKGSKEVPAKDVKECADACLNADKCLVLSWADDKCYLLEDDGTELKPGNLEPRIGALTLLGKKKRLFKIRKLIQIYGGQLHFGDIQFDDYDDDNYENQPEDETLGPALGELGCQNDQKCLDFLKLARIKRALWIIKWGWFYKGLKVVPAKGIKECVEICKDDEKCFLMSWTEKDECYVQDDGVTDFKPENLEARVGVLTLFGKVKRIKKFRKHRKGEGFYFGTFTFTDDYDSADEGEGYGCQNDEQCMKLIKLVEGVKMFWRVKWGWYYKGLKEVSANNVNDCVQACMDNVKCYVSNWAEDKCSVQEDGSPEEEVNLENLEARSGSITFVGRLGRLVAFRQMVLESEAEGGPGDEYFSSEKDQNVVYSNIVIQGKEVKVCMVTWRDANYLAKSMEQMTKATTEEDCVNYCVRSNKCTANSFRPNSGQKCWILNGDFLLSEKDLVSEEGDFTSLKQNCDDANTQSGEWEVSSDESCEGLHINIDYVEESMVPVKQSTSEACHNFCRDSDECKASSFRPKTEEKCWIFNSDDFASNDKTEMAEGVITYMKFDCAAENETGTMNI